MELGSFLKIPDDTISENRKLSILQKIYSNYKPKRTAKNVQSLFTVKNVIKFKYFVHYIIYFAL